jgi:3-oxoacyl-[acyl-carrier protein] reductase
MNLNLQNKNALVCGSSQGLGLASAIELSLLGANVILFARNEEKLKIALSKLNTDKGQTHSYIIADFNNYSSVKNAIENLLSRNIIIHILINNT